MTLDEAKDLALREKEAEIAALKLELRALQPDEQMSLLRVAQKDNAALKARLGRVVRVAKTMCGTCVCRGECFKCQAFAALKPGDLENL